MSIWNLSDNQRVTADASFEVGGGSMEPIPANTLLKAMIDEVKWDDYQGDQYISIRWSVVDGEFKNRKIFHKLRVMEDDTKKRDKAVRMLAAIDANAGGKLMSLGRDPENGDLSANLCYKPMAIRVQIWEMPDDSGNMRSGNWVSMVSPLSGAVAQAASAAPRAAAPAAMDNFDDDIPF